MFIQQLNLANFRNYSQTQVKLHPGLNILVGENAQGKTNFLEAIELLSTGQSNRTNSEAEFIRHGDNRMHIEMQFQARNVDESLALSFFNDTAINSNSETASSSSHDRQKKRTILVNGVSYSMLKKLRGRLITVTFNSFDLNLLRGGPTFRRDWIDSVIVRIKPLFYEQLSKYQKVVQQRNKLLKSLYESNHLYAKDNNELDAWDEQVAKYGAIVILWRRKVLQELILKAKHYLALISEQNEQLSIAYRCRCTSIECDNKRHHDGQNFQDMKVLDDAPTHSHANDVEEERKLVEMLLYSLNKRRLEEIVRGQTLSGPHRDDIMFFLNGTEATSFASQGQQRSLVLALKLSELEMVKEHLQEPPVLLLDDVLAELDLKRQALLMAQINSDMQTIISTTHVSSFNSHWLENAHFYEVKSGTIEKSELKAIIK